MKFGRNGLGVNMHRLTESDSDMT